MTDNPNLVWKTPTQYPYFPWVVVVGDLGLLLLLVVVDVSPTYRPQFLWKNNEFFSVGSRHVWGVPFGSFKILALF